MAIWQKGNSEVFQRVYSAPGAAIWSMDEPAEELVELIDNSGIKPSKTLDLGCGEGTNAVYLASKGFEASGVDISENAVRFAAQRAAAKGVNVEFRQLDVLDREARASMDGNFDFVLEWGLMHHIPYGERQNYVEWVSGLLKEGGKYASASFDVSNTNYGSRGQRIRKTNLGTTLYHSSDAELRELFSPHFRILEQRSKPITMPAKCSLLHHANFYFMEKERL